MLAQKYKYTRKYIINKIKEHKLLHAFLIEEKIYNKYVRACIECNTVDFNIDDDFKNNPFMCFRWADAYHFIDGWHYNSQYFKFIKKLSDEI